MNPIRRRFGLKWPSKTPSVTLIDWILGLAFFALAICVYALVGFIGANVVLADSNARAVHRADHAEAALIACLNKRPILDGRTAILCDPIHQQL